MSGAVEVIDGDRVDIETGEVLEPVRTQVPAIRGREKVGGLLRPVAQPEDVLAAQEETRALVERALQPNRDFGVIPGTQKPTLLKPGAERINAAFGVRPRYRIVDQEVDHDRAVSWTKRKKRWEGGKFAGWDEESGSSEGLYRYVIECELVHRESGVPVGQGMGSCSTMESKYVDRPRECENVALKMAQKRALIAATLNAYGLSDQFTQDMEDMETSAAPFSLDSPVGFGKYGEMTWRELAKDQPGYVRWLRDETDKLTPEMLEALRAVLRSENGGEPGEEKDGRSVDREEMEKAEREKRGETIEGEARRLASLRKDIEAAKEETKVPWATIIRLTGEAVGEELQGVRTSDDWREYFGGLDVPRAEKVHAAVEAERVRRTT